MLIHTVWASNRRLNAGARSAPASMEPRETSISSASTSVTDIGATASSRSPSKVTILSTAVRRPEGSSTTESPGFTLPETIRPAKPRKPSCGRITICTGKRNGPWQSDAAGSMLSRYSSRADPPYHGIRADRSTTLSPSSALTGMKDRRAPRSRGASASNSVRIDS